MFEINPELEVQIRSTEDITWQVMGNGERIFNLNRIRKTHFVIDNFYKNPDEIRDYTLSQLKDFKNVWTDKDGIRPDDSKLGGAIGRRIYINKKEIGEEMKVNMSPVFEYLCKNKAWHIKFDKKHHYEMWRCPKFVVNATNHNEVIRSKKPWCAICHVDGNFSKWASLVYLNTSDEYGQEEIPGTGFYSVVPPDPDGIVNPPKLERIVPIRYNRCVLYDANQVHGPIYKPELYHNYDRLTQVMFF